VFTWDYHSSISFWSGLRVQPILADEVQTFKALITVHKVLQEGHPVVRSASGFPQYSFVLLAPLTDYQGGSRSDRVARNVLSDSRDGKPTRYPKFYFMRSFYDVFLRIWPIDQNIRSIPLSQTQVPSLETRVQRFV
jgi:hypothetical protein